MIKYLQHLELTEWIKLALSIWTGFVVFFAFVILWLFVSVGPPPQAEQQGVLWFYVRHWLAGALIFPVYILVFSVIIRFGICIARYTRGGRARRSDV